MAAELKDVLTRHYGLQIIDLHPVGGGYDLMAERFRVECEEGDSYFLKIRPKPFPSASLEAPLFLWLSGLGGVVPPILTNDLNDHVRIGDSYGALFRFIDGADAFRQDPTEEQWRSLGLTLRTIHDSSLYRELVEVEIETFALKAASDARDIDRHIHEIEEMFGARQRFSKFWKANVAALTRLICLAEELGHDLSQRDVKRVLCHADLHRGNILLSKTGDAFLVDWEDGPRIAPRERDFIFVIRSEYASHMTEGEQACFFAGYGPVEVDDELFKFFTYERALEDITVSAKNILFNEDLTEEQRDSLVDDSTGQYWPGTLLASL